MAQGSHHLKVLLPVLALVFALLFAQRAQVGEATRATPTLDAKDQDKQFTVKEAILQSQLGKLTGLEFTPEVVRDLTASVGKRLQQKRRERLLKLSNRKKSEPPLLGPSSSQAVQSDASSSSSTGEEGDAEVVELTGRYPVIFIPGLMGSQLEVRLHERKDSPDWFCRRSTSQWSRIWMIDTLHMIPELTKCWLQDMLLNWNATSKTMAPAEGIASRANPTFEGAMEVDKNSPVSGLWCGVCLCGR